MSIRLFWSSFALCLALSATAAESTATSPLQVQTAKHFSASPTINVDYLLFLPPGCDLKGEKRWPLIFFLHGAGERGSDLRKVAVHGPPHEVTTHPDFPFIIVSPQCPDGQIWSTETLRALLDDVLRTYPVDSTRVYLTGLSMGGFGTWSLAAAHPEKFAALAPICGGGNPRDAANIEFVRAKVHALTSRFPVYR